VLPRPLETFDETAKKTVIISPFRLLAVPRCRPDIVCYDTAAPRPWLHTPGLSAATQTRPTRRARVEGRSHGRHRLPSRRGVLCAPLRRVLGRATWSHLPAQVGTHTRMSVTVRLGITGPPSVGSGILCFSPGSSREPCQTDTCRRTVQRGHFLPGSYPIFARQWVARSPRPFFPLTATHRSLHKSRRQGYRLLLHLR
jgi:hypothetical protein